MRVVARLLLVVTVCVGALIGFSMFAAKLSVTVGEVRVVPASDMMEQFQALQQAVQEGALIGKQFREGQLGDSYAYEFHIYTVRLKNNGLIPADWVRLEAQPEAQDVLQAESENPDTVPALKSGDVQALVLADKGSSTARSLTATYFIWSRSYSLPIQQQ